MICNLGDPMSLRHPVLLDLRLGKLHIASSAASENIHVYICMCVYIIYIHILICMYICQQPWPEFRKRATNYRALLRKMTSEDKASYNSTPPCTILLCICVFLTCRSDNWVFTTRCDLVQWLSRGIHHPRTTEGKWRQQPLHESVLILVYDGYDE